MGLFSEMTKEEKIGYIVLIMVGGILVWLISSLESTFTLPGAVAVAFIVFWTLVKLASRFVIYPGSSWLFRRSIEMSLSEELSTGLINKTGDIIYIFESLLSTGSLQCYSQPFLALSSLRVLLIDLQEQEEITGSQLYMLRLLSEFDSLAQQIHLYDPSSGVTISVPEMCEKDSSYIVVEGCNESIKDAVSVLKEMQIFIFESSLKEGFFIKLKRWFKEDLVGSLNFMRAEMIRKYHAQQIWIESEDSTKVDCLWIPGHQDYPCILLCSANAGFYEFAHFQTQWLDYYSNLGMNLMMWNYRGFARTKGSPSISNCIMDGKSIVHYLRERKGMTKIGVHGHSLGGAVAIALAKECSLDFLFADRTFWSLIYAAYFNYGKVASWLLWLTGSDSKNMALDYLDVSCYKVISCDHKDNMIDDLASLKSGVAYSLMFETLYEHDYEMFKRKDIEELGYLISPSEIRKTYNAIQKLLNPKLIAKDIKETETTSLVDEDETNQSEIKEILRRIRAAGKPLTSVWKHGHFSMLVWILASDLWPNNINKLKYVKENLAGIIESSKTSNNEVWVIIRLLDLMIERSEQKKGENVKVFSKGNHMDSSVDYKKAGNLMSIRCGHSGFFSYYEIRKYENHLISSGFIKLDD